MSAARNFEVVHRLSFGGLCAIDLARTGADILGAISFHGLLTPPGNTKKIQAKLLITHGWADPMAAPDADRRSWQAARNFLSEIFG